MRRWGILIPYTLGSLIKSSAERLFGILTDVGPVYKVPNQSESLTWISAGLIRTIGPTYIITLFLHLLQEKCIKNYHRYRACAQSRT